MKQRLSAVAAFLFVAASSSFAFADNFGTAGCGLGSLAFKDEPGKIQIVAGILNFTAVQTFAITSGTSNCTEMGNTSAMFINVNKVALQKDISRGNGESLATLSQILKCSDTAKLGQALQKNYGTIFPSDTTPATEIDKSIQSTIRSDSTLAKSCQAVG